MFASKDTLLTRPSGYSIARSVRLRSSASAYFNRTLGSGNAQKFTLSMWCKLSQNNAGGFLFDAYSSGTVRSLFQLDNSTGTTIQFYSGNGTVTQYFTTNQVFRDPSAWYHLVFKVDTTASTNGIVLYVNGVATSLTWNNTLAQNTNLIFNTAVAHNIGKYGGGAAYFDGYLTEINFIDGQALTPSSFGETDSITGVWKAKKYSGTYGTNGFYLNFSDNSSNTATTIGKDYSGNGNNWTPNNISVTAGVTYDSMQDVPTLTSANAGNYCVMNPLNLPKGGTLSNGNLLWTSPTTEGQAVGTMYVSSGKFYWEMVLNTAGSGCAFGIASITTDINNINLTAGSYVYYTNGNKYNGGTGSAYGATFTNGDIIGVALDLDAGTLIFYKNNTSQGTAFTGLSGTFTALIYDGTSASAPTFNANFGQQPFTYTPPTGYVALNTYNLPASTIKNGAAYMAATTYTGTGASLAVSNAVNGVSFQPDLVWIKARGNTYSHNIEDSVRGVTLRLQSDSTAAEAVGANGQVTAFSSGGFTQNGGVETGGSSATYVGWQWKAGGTSSSNTNGSITSTVSVGATQGFSVVTYTGTGTAGTVGHGLGVAPSMIIVKSRSAAGTDWPVYHASLTSPASTIVLLNSTSASLTFPTIVANYWNGGTTSTTFGISTATGINTSSATYVAYCFSAVAGYSAFGSYTGNGSTDGPFIFTGFRPRFVVVKRTDGTSHWQMFDSSRSTYNAIGNMLIANLSDAEYAQPPYFDFLSNGIKARGTGAGQSGGDYNFSGGTYIYMAFAENPFKYSLAR